MNYYVYLRRRAADISLLKFKLQRMFSFLHRSDFERVQDLLDEVNQILKKYDAGQGN